MFLQWVFLTWVIYLNLLYGNSYRSGWHGEHCRWYFGVWVNTSWTVPFFRQRVSAQGIKPDPGKVKAIKEWPTLTNVKELQAFLGSVNYLSRFIPQLSCWRTPLQPLVRNNSEFLWLQTHTDAFEKIKCAISDDCFLQFNDVSHPLLIEWDAPKKDLVCILLQPMDKNMTNCDISYFSEKEMDEFYNI